MTFRETAKASLFSGHGLFALFVFFSFFILPYAFYSAAAEPALSLRFLLLSVLIFILGAAGLIADLKRGEQPFHSIPRVPAALFAVYFAAYLLSFFAAINKSEACFEIGKAFLFSAYALFAIQLLHSPGRLFIAARAITISALIMAVIGILEYWDLFRMANTGMPPGAMIFNRNLLSSFLFLALGFCFITTAVNRGWWQAIGIACFLAISYLLVLTRTRAVWIAGAAVVAVFSFLVIRFGIVSFYHKIRKRARLFIVIAAVPMLAVSAGAFSTSARQFKGKHTIPDAIKSITDKTNLSNTERVLLWKKTLSMIHDHPLTGVGAGNWKIEMPGYGIQDLLDSATFMKATEIRPYNDFLWVFAETGIAGFISYIGLFLLCGWYLIGSGFKHEGENRILRFILFPFLLGFMVIALLDFPKERIEHLVSLGVVFAFSISLGRRVSCFRIPRPVYRLLLVSISIMSLGCAWIGVSRLQGDIHVAKMRAATQERDWKTVIAESDRAWTPFYTLEPSGTPLHWYRGVADFRLGNSAAACADYEQARRYHPYHLHVLNDLGTSLSLQGRQDEAESCYVAALRVCSDFEPTRVNLAALYYNAGRLDQAFRMISLCKEPHFDPRYENFEKIITDKFKKGGRS